MIARLAVVMLALLGASAPLRPPARPPVVAAKVIRSFPHDRTAFTEGLLITDGALYESTGREGQSFIRRVDLKTGRTLHQAALPPGVFGEGIVAWKGELRSVVWHGGQGHRWSLPMLKHTGGFRYDGEGWAMTDNGRQIILSDGTSVLRFLDPTNMTVVRRLTVTLAGKLLRQINELEYVCGEVLANIWMTSMIARIDPATGAVRGLIDLSNLVAQVNATDPDSVANGIAYDRKGDHLYVTGKNWPRVFEISRPAC